MDAIAVFKMIAGLVGGLALFLYGMNIMSGGLTKASGGQLEHLLARVTKNRWLAYLFGIGVTAVVQSSSASTVMVVGLVNSGIMKLAEAVNVILGANLGTTFTAWLLSLNAISTDNFFLNLFKPMSFSPFLALIGIALLMFTKSDKKKNLGIILIGFAVLIFGMDMMSSAVMPLRSSAEFQSFLTTFTNPLVGLLIGVVFTMVIQSSAGTIAVLQALSSTIFISYGMALPVVIGAEVGTCITAIISSIGANKNGKRTALMHLYFNIIKASTFMIVFYSLNALFRFAFLQDQASMVGIAFIHTAVNLVATPLMVPFSGLLVKLALKTIPIDEKEKEQQDEERRIAALDTRFLSTPAFALQQAKLAANDMADMSKDALDKAMHLFEGYTNEDAEEVARIENTVDRYEDQLGTYLVHLSSTDLNQRDSHSLSIILHCITDFERISDHAYNLMLTAKGMHEDNKHFSSKAQEELRIFSDAVREIVDMSVRVFRNEDLVLAKSVEPLEEVIDGLHMEVRRRHIRRLRKGKCTIDLGFALNDLGTDYERIADHCSNIAVCLLQVSQDGFDTHEYLEMIRQEKSESFEQAVEHYERRYSLPSKKASEEEEAALTVQEVPSEETPAKEKDKDLLKKAKEKAKEKKDKIKEKTKEKLKEPKKRA